MDILCLDSKKISHLLNIHAANKCYQLKHHFKNNYNTHS